MGLMLSYQSILEHLLPGPLTVSSASGLNIVSSSGP